MEKERETIDCRWFPSENKCTLAISGTREEVIKAAVAHAVTSHGEKDTPEFREKINKMLRAAKE